MACYNFPYTNFHDINLDWILKQVQDLQNYVNDQINDIIEQKVQIILADATLTAYYDATMETVNIKWEMNPEEGA